MKDWTQERCSERPAELQVIAPGLFMQRRSIQKVEHEADETAGLEAYTEYVCESRELEVAWLLYRGYTNRQIGEELYIAETTVKKHVSHIYQKMEVYSRKDFRAKVQRESRGLSQE